MAAHEDQDNSLFSKRNVLGTLLIILFTFLCVTVSLVALSTNCINNYHENMLIYPGAENIAEESSLANYFSAGKISSTWIVDADADTVYQWYWQRMQGEIDERTGAYIAPLWQGDYQVNATSDGTEIILSPSCF